MAPIQVFDLQAARKTYNQHLFRSGDFSDFTVHCDGAVFRVHRAVICVCPFFEGACRRGFKEADAGVIDMDHDEPEVVRAVLQYLYTQDYLEDTLKRATLLFLAKVYALADMLDVPGLKERIVADFIDQVAYGIDGDTSQSDFLEAVQHTYNNTIDTDEGLRNALVACTIRHAKQLLEGDVVARRSRHVLRECPEFAIDLAMSSIAASKTDGNRSEKDAVAVSVTQTTVGGYESSDEDGFI